MAAALAVVLVVSRIGAEEAIEGPVVRALPSTEAFPSEPLPSEAPLVAVAVPAAVPAAEPIPVAETVPARVEEGPAVDPDAGSSEVSALEVDPFAGNALTIDPVPRAKPGVRVGVIPVAETVLGSQEILAPDLVVVSEGTLVTALDPDFVGPVQVGKRGDGEPTLRELALRDHRRQLEIYDLDDDSAISEDEWKAANRDDLARGEKFFLVDKNEDGKIDEDEAVRFVMERVSLASTYLDVTEEDGSDFLENEIKEHAPSEVRFTLFSIPLGGD